MKGTFPLPTTHINLSEHKSGRYGHRFCVDHTGVRVLSDWLHNAALCHKRGAQWLRVSTHSAALVVRGCNPRDAVTGGTQLVPLQVTAPFRDFRMGLILLRLGHHSKLWT